MNSDEAERLSAALASPHIIDSGGNLYVLSGGGETVLVAGPLQDDGKRFHAAGENGHFKWLLESRALYLLDRNTPARVFVVPLAEDLPPFVIREPYPRCFILGDEHIVVNTERACGVYRFRDALVDPIATFPDFRCMGACRQSDGQVLLAGMRPREIRSKTIPHVTRELYEVTAYGQSKLVALDTRSRAFETREGRNRELVRARFGSLNPVDLVWGVGVEAWLACLQAREKTMLVGGLVDFAPYEQDMDLLAPNPHVDDFRGVVIAEARSVDELEPVSILEDCSLQAVLSIAPGRSLLVLRTKDADGAGFVRLWSDRIAEAPDAFDFTEAALRDRKIWYADFEYDERIGLFAILETYSDDYRKRSAGLYLCRDMARWDLAHALPTRDWGSSR